MTIGVKMIMTIGVKMIRYKKNNIGVGRIFVCVHSVVLCFFGRAGKGVFCGVERNARAKFV